MTDNKVVHGWCIEYTHQGAAPSLTECDVTTTDTPGLFTENVGPGQLRVHTQGVTFFDTIQPARQGLIERLQDAKEAHLFAIAYIEGQIETCRTVMKDEAEREKQQGGELSGGAKPRC